jgi:thiol-disulfide isomerase/thioredoxin
MLCHRGVLLVFLVSFAVSCSASDGTNYSLNISTDVHQNNEVNESNATDTSCQLNAVKRVNASELLAVVAEEKSQGKNHSVFFVTFYSLNCPFSKKLAPIFSALPSAFPSLRFFKLNAAKEPHLNLRFGVFGYPSIVFFKNGQALRRYDGPYNSTDLEKFVHETSLVPPLSVRSLARISPPPYVEDEEKERDLFLYFSIAVTLILPLEFLFGRFCSRS